MRAERLRLARELHDVVTNAVTAMVLQAAAARTQVKSDQPELAELLALIETTGVEAVSELYQVLGLLCARAGGTDGMDAVGGAGRTPDLADLPCLLSRSRATGLEVSLITTGAPRRLDPDIETTGYRVVQEGLTNALRYAGTESSVEIRLDWGRDCLQIRVRDHRSNCRQDPVVPIAAVSGGFGWQGLSERVHLVQGRLTRRILPDGFELVALLPVSTPRSAA